MNCAEILEMDLDILRMTFIAQNVHFKNLSFDLLNSRSLSYGGPKFKYSFKVHYNLIAVGLH